MGSARAGTVGWAAVICLVVAASDLPASEFSQASVSQGLAALNDGRTEAALLLFTRALDQDPADVDALYYRGLARARLEQFASAIEDLSRVVSERPGMHAAQMGLGYAYYAARKYSAAEIHLAQVGRHSPMAGRARFYLGMARMRSGQPAAAAEAFGEAEELDASLATTARYYHGVAAVRSGDREGAREKFLAVKDQTDKPALARAAAEQLEELGAGRSYRLYGSVGFEYDSNVVLVADDDTLGDAELDSIGVSNKDDGRTVIAAGAFYTPYQRDGLGVSLGYELFQSVHFDLSEFDLQDHRATLGIAYERSPITLGVATTYDYYLRQTKSFLGEVAVLPWLRHTSERWGSTDLYYRMEDRTFHGIHFGKDVEDFRGGRNHAAGIAQTVPLAGGAGYVSLGYRFDHDDADHSDGRAFDYDGHLLDFELGWSLPAGIELATGYSYKYEDYASQSDGREDNVHHAKLALRRALTDVLAVRAEYRATVNDSNEDLYEYERHVATIALEASY